jgi:hypothetical protein
MICVIFYFADCDFPFSGATQEGDQILAAMSGAHTHTYKSRW